MSRHANAELCRACSIPASSISTRPDGALEGPVSRGWNQGLDYSRNRGMRIDLLAADTYPATRLETTWIDHLERGAEHASDYAALIADFK